MFITTQLTLFLATDMQCDGATVLKFLHPGIFIFNKYFSLFTSRDFSFAIFSFVITGNINKQIKTKLLKSEEDILLYA